MLIAILQVLSKAPFKKQCLLGHIRHHLLDIFKPNLIDAPPIELDTPRVSFLQFRDEVEKCGLAAAARAGECDH